MRIISSFKDYYDCVQSQGQDQSLLYLREPKEVVLEGRQTPFQFTTILQRWGNDIIYGCNVIGFCGRVIPVLSLCHPQDSSIKPVFAYTLAEVDSFVEAHFKKARIERYYAAKRKSYWSELWRYTSHRTIDEFFQEAARHAGDFEHLFQNNRSPIFTYRECRAGHILTFNGCLKEFQFFKLVDPYTAFQEIQMYLGGMAFPNKPMPQIDDKTMAEAKGFNKWSFRKESKQSHK
jgi:hypothetical protein